MLKKTITYKDFNDVDRTEDFYFNLSKTELIEMETSVDGGMGKLLEKIVAAEDVNQMFRIVKKIILASVGIKSEDGKRFTKSDEIAKDFVSSPAFDVLFMEFATDADKAAAFVKGIIPTDLVSEFDNTPKKVELVSPSTQPDVQG